MLETSYSSLLTCQLRDMDASELSGRSPNLAVLVFVNAINYKGKCMEKYPKTKMFLFRI